MPYITSRHTARELVADEKMVDKYKKEFNKLSFTGYDLKWFSFLAKIDNRSFKLFVETSPADERFEKKSYNQYEFGFSFNRYYLNSSTRGSYFANLSANITVKDNFGSLTKVVVKETEEISPVPDQQVIERSTTAYKGTYETGIRGFKLDYNRYQFLNYNRTFALRLNPTATTPFDEFDFKLNGVIGLLVGFKNKDDKNIINSELYYEVEDILADDKEENDSFIDRSSVGVRLSFPIQFAQKL